MCTRELAKVAMRGVHLSAATQIKLLFVQCNFHLHHPHHQHTHTHTLAWRQFYSMQTSSLWFALTDHLASIRSHPSSRVELDCLVLSDLVCFNRPSWASPSSSSPSPSSSSHLFSGRKLNEWHGFENTSIAINKLSAPATAAVASAQARPGWPPSPS